ncbi:hypothetical protein [Halobacterium hubeiense]|uniref:hypothetical protein n=1 Tax=Halobacterium hubeiense TaxID=1407499 RepID=UPI003C73B955
MATPNWSDEHVTRANRFTLHVVLAWVLLVTLQAAVVPTGTIGLVFAGAFALGATWLLVHSLFTQVDQLTKTRIEEANRAGGSD